MAQKVYEKGTVKVVWIGDDPERIYSQMFDDEKNAQAFASEKGDYIIFSLVKQKNMESFEWKILPYGEFDTYSKLMKIYKSKGELVKRLLGG